MMSKASKKVIGVDFGGTKILAGKVEDGQILSSHKTLVPAMGSENEVLVALFEAIDAIIDEDVVGIGVGVPSIVDTKLGIVYDVQNIPSWKKVYLKDILQHKYEIPAYINNDANCFAVGEKHYGHGRNHANFAAVINGTGMAAGLIIHDKLYDGSNCGAGEFGTIPYLDHTFEYYCSGQFFSNVYNIDALEAHELAVAGDKHAIDMFVEFGGHFGNAINAILYTIDPEIIVLGGSVTKAYDFFEKSMWVSIEKLAFRTVVEHLTIKLSTNPDLAVLGAAALYFDALSDKVKHPPDVVQN
jgi:glucokinase